MTKRNLSRCGALLLAAAALLIIPACQNHAMKNADAVTELEMNKDIDLGLILDTTSPLNLSIPITNRASRAVTIQKLAKDCSCTSVKIDKFRLEPGETATLTIVTNLTGKTNGYVGNVIVESDAVERVSQIRVHGRITGQIRIRPARATVLLGDKPAPCTFSVFSDDQDGAWRYAGFTSDEPGLGVTLERRETSAITSVYDGTINLGPEVPGKTYSKFQTAQVTLRFINDQLGRRLDLKYGVDLVSRRHIGIDPAQVTFLSEGGLQKRTIMVQSADTLSLDAVRCPSVSIRSSVHRISPQTASVQLVYLPKPGRETDPQPLACELLSDGKTIGSVPINIVEIR